MFHSISVCTGDSDHAKIAQEHAIWLANYFNSRLRVASVWNPEDAEKFANVGENLSKMSKREQDELVHLARESNVHCDTVTHGEGVLDGLIAEAHDCDLLILGVPKSRDTNDAFAKAVWQLDLDVIRNAECNLLLVCNPRQPIQRVLVNYQGGHEGKNALRIAGELAQKMDASLDVVAMDSDEPEAATLAASAGEYLKSFDLIEVKTHGREGDPESGIDILNHAKDLDADFIVVGDDPYGLFNRFMGEDTAEEVVSGTTLPVLIAR